MRARTNILLVSLSTMVSILVLLLSKNLGPDGLDGWHRALKSTVQFSSLIFVVAFVIGPLSQRWPTKVIRYLKVNRRGVGLAFAASMTVHLAAVLGYLSNGGAIPQPLALLIEGFAALCLVVLAITSNDWSMRRFGFFRWRRIQTFGMYVIWLALFIPFTNRISLNSDSIIYMFLSIVLAAALAIRVFLSTSLKRRKS